MTALLNWISKHKVMTVMTTGIAVFVSTFFITWCSAGIGTWAFFTKWATLLTIAAYVVGVVGVAVAFLAVPEKVAIEDLERAKLSDDEVFGTDSEDAAVETLPIGAPRTFPFQGKNLSYYEPADVPLKVLADLVNYWEGEHHTGRFTVGDIQYFLRGTGRGNHPWLMRFADEQFFWRVAYGGQSKTVATVSRVGA